jgi:hypothetical protein
VWFGTKYVKSVIVAFALSFELPVSCCPVPPKRQSVHGVPAISPLLAGRKKLLLNFASTGEMNGVRKPGSPNPSIVSVSKPHLFLKSRY